jgi:hypothetical protein
MLRLRKSVALSQKKIIAGESDLYFLLAGWVPSKSLKFGVPLHEDSAMSYKLRVKEAETLGKSKYVNAAGKTECAEFVRQATGAPPTIAWKMATKVSDAKPGEILRGTAIATFDSNGKYPVGAKGKHAAIYLEHNVLHILVLDQWSDQGEVRQRPIAFKRPPATRRSNNGDTIYVIE